MRSKDWNNLPKLILSLPNTCNMTLNQTEKLKRKIAEIKRILEAEKRRFGCYDDSRGLRYIPASYFVRLGDYAVGLALTKAYSVKMGVYTGDQPGKVIYFYLAI